VGPVARLRIATLVVVLLVYVAVVAAVHIAQGTADLGVGDVVRWVFDRVAGTPDPAVEAVITSSRLPRVVAGVVVGVALGVCGAVMQSFSRNLLASPDTMAVNPAAFLALTASAAFGVRPAIFGDLGIAFIGGLAGALLVLVMAGTDYGTVRLVLAGITLGLVFGALSTTLIILFPMEVNGLYAWSAGSLSQNGFGATRQLGPVILVALALVAMLTRRLDLMMLGDDEAASLGVPVRRTQLQLLLLSVLLAAAAVTMAGPIGYVGLVAPTLVRLLASRVPGLHRHAVLLPVAGLAGVALLLTADVVLRALVGAQRSIQVPTGVTTSLIGGLVLLLLAVRLRASRLGGGNDTLDVHSVGWRSFPVGLALCLVGLGVSVVVALLVGDRMLLVGDLGVWLSGNAGPIVSGVMSTRFPRVVAALLAGLALAVAGSVIQGVTRNPLADAGIIGISGGAAMCGVLVVTFLPAAGFWFLSASAGFGALLAAAVVFGLTVRGGFATDRLILVGVGFAICSEAVVTMVIVATDPFNQTKALTWLSGSTYGRTFDHLVPLGVGCLVLVPLVLAASRQLDLLSVDNDLPVVLGLPVPQARFLLLVSAVLLTGAAVAAIGPVVFVGLVAPHAARSLVGRRHARVIPVAALLGATVVVWGDLLGRTVIAPMQLPASLLTAVIGAPYFFYLLVQRRSSRG
jgi:iron complex transport system permease protein